MNLEQMIEQTKAQAMAREIRRARTASLVVRIPENITDDTLATTLDISLKVWDVLTGLLEIAGTVKLAAGAGAAAKISVEAIAANEAAALAAATAGSGKVTVALTAGEAIALAGPLVAYIGLWVGLGSPYFEARQKIAEDRARRGVAHGVLIGAFGHSPTRARGFALRQNEGPNHWDEGASAVARNSYIMAFIAGYKQGRDLSPNQRKVFWKAFAHTLRKNQVSLWNNDWRGDAVWDRWFWEAGTAFQRHHIKG